MSRLLRRKKPPPSTRAGFVGGNRRGGGGPRSGRPERTARKTFSVGASQSKKPDRKQKQLADEEVESSSGGEETAGQGGVYDDDDMATRSALPSTGVDEFSDVGEGQQEFDLAELTPAKRRRLRRDVKEAIDQDQQPEKEGPRRKLRDLAAEIDLPSASDIGRAIVYKPHRFSPTALAFSTNGRYVVSVAKGGSIVKYDLQSGHKCGRVRQKRHHGAVLTCAISPDDQFLVTGGDDTAINVWRLDSLELVKGYPKLHRAAVTALTFKKCTSPSMELYSGSDDKAIKAWHLSSAGQLGLVDTMFGHTSGVESMDALQRPRVLSCGGQDKSIRLFKVAEERQLVFEPSTNTQAVDCVTFIDDEHFVSGGADGSISLWSTAKKRPICTRKGAHGSSDGVRKGDANWISALAACPGTNLVASGSRDGLLKLWRITEGFKSLDELGKIPMIGFINYLAFSPLPTNTDNHDTIGMAKSKGFWLACAVGQEHRRGRWWRLKEARNRVVIIPLITEKKDLEPNDWHEDANTVMEGHVDAA